MNLSSFVQFFTVLVIFIGVLALTYFTTRWIANYQKVNLTGGNIEVLETSRISTTKYMQIVRVGSHYVAIAVGKDTVTKICDLSEEELSSVNNAGIKRGKEPVSFRDIFSQMRKKGESEDADEK